ncbi:hypothetical protein GCM10010401_11290 [Rarobacter faecitabidus]|uniref:chromate transporter n=1 Tax=Rarobacter faecitabidus TaxID=13243 RepID=UPI0031E1740D
MNSVFRVFLRLGLTSFGGPIAHLGYFREEFVGRRRWLRDEDFAGAVALSQFLPGASSSQVGMLVGLGRRGMTGLIAAWIGFTLPSAALMIGAGYASQTWATSENSAVAGAISGLKAVAAAVVLQAVIQMGRVLTPDAQRLAVAASAAALVLLWPVPWIHVAVVVVSGLLGFASGLPQRRGAAVRRFRKRSNLRKPPSHAPVGSRSTSMASTEAVEVGETIGSPAPGDTTEGAAPGDTTEGAAPGDTTEGAAPGDTTEGATVSGSAEALDRTSGSPDGTRSFRLVVSPRLATLAAAMFGFLLVALPIAVRLTGDGTVRLIDACFRAGSLVFGGGHVVLPLLESATVPSGMVDSSTFMAGYGTAQALPGPLFSFAAYLGTVSTVGPGGALGGLIALVAIFLPSALLVIAAIPLWERLRANPAAGRAVAAVGAAVVGLLAAACYDPVIVTGVTSWTTAAIALGSFVLLVSRRVPVWLIVAGAAGAGLALR